MPFAFREKAAAVAVRRPRERWGSEKASYRVHTSRNIRSDQILSHQQKLLLSVATEAQVRDP